MEGVPEGEDVGTCLKRCLHRTEEVPGILVGSVLRILINPQDLSIDIEDDVFMILILVARGIARAAAIRMTLHHPSQKVNFSSDCEVEGV